MRAYFCQRPPHEGDREWLPFHFHISAYSLISNLNFRKRYQRGYSKLSVIVNIAPDGIWLLLELDVTLGLRLFLPVLIAWVCSGDWSAQTLTSVQRGVSPGVDKRIFSGSPTERGRRSRELAERRQSALTGFVAKSP